MKKKNPEDSFELKAHGPIILLPNIIKLGKDCSVCVFFYFCLQELYSFDSSLSSSDTEDEGIGKKDKKKKKLKKKKKKVCVTKSLPIFPTNQEILTVNAFTVKECLENWFGQTV